MTSSDFKDTSKKNEEIKWLFAINFLEKIWTFSQQATYWRFPFTAKFNKCKLWSHLLDHISDRFAVATPDETKPKVATFANLVCVKYSQSAGPCNSLPRPFGAWHGSFVAPCHDSAEGGSAKQVMRRKTKAGRHKREEGNEDMARRA